MTGKDDAPPAKRKRIGWVWYLAVLVAVLGMSWGGPLFALLGKDTPPFMKAGWRLQLMVLTMAPMAGWQWRQSPPELRARWRSKLGVLALNGVVFAVHLCSFAWAIDHTSFSHAMIIVATLPMLLVTWAAVLFLAYRTYEAQQQAAVSSSSNNDVGGNSTGEAPVASEGLSLAASAAQVTVDTTALNGGSESATATSLPGATEGGSSSAAIDAPVVAPKPLKTQVSLSSAGKAASTAGSIPRRRTGSTSLAGGESGVAIVLENYEEPPPRAAPSKQAALSPLGGDSGAPSPVEQASASAGEAAAAPETRLHKFVRFARGGDPSPPLPPTRQEAIGSVVAFIGLALLVSGKSDGESSSGTATVAGDFMAFTAALSMAIYVLVGQSIRRWMPTWMYAAPLMASSCVTAILLSLMFEEGTSLFSAGPRGAFGYFGTGRDFGITTAAAIVPGFLGHGIANLALARINPLVLSVVQLIQPGISVMEGSAIGVQKDLPEGVLFSAPIIFLGIFMVVTGSRNAPKPHAANLRLRVARAFAAAVKPCFKRGSGSVATALAGSAAKLTKLEGSA